MITTHTFDNIEPNDKVTFRIANGTDRVNGKAVVQYKQVTGSARICNTVAGTVAVSLGGKYGTPGLVTRENFVSVRKSAQ